MPVLFSYISLLRKLYQYTTNGMVSELLGHTQIGITMDVYSHLLPGMQKDAMGKLNEALRRREGDDKRESS